MQDEWGDLVGRTVTWVGDYNNVARSLCLAAARTGMAARIASPPGYGPTDSDIERLLAAGMVAAPFVTTRPAEAAEGADAVHTDVWASMGHEAKAIFLHCLPAHRGEEVAASVVDGPQSRAFPQAHNRLHAFRGLLRFLLEEA
jgi:ornithine carbamoyltransferase